MYQTAEFTTTRYVLRQELIWIERSIRQFYGKWTSTCIIWCAHTLNCILQNSKKMLIKGLKRNLSSVQIILILFSVWFLKPYSLENLALGQYVLCQWSESSLTCSVMANSYLATCIFQKDGISEPIKCYLKARNASLNVVAYKSQIT